MKTKLFAAVAAAAVIAACASPSTPKSSMRGVSVTENSIVGGTVVSDFSFPYVVHIIANGWICTGTLIDDFVVLTAAHCVSDSSNPGDYYVYGADDVYGEGYYWEAPVAEVHYHPDYDEQDLVNDVGILILAVEPAQEDPTGKTRPIPYLASDNGSIYDDSPATSFTAVGFGVTSGSSNDSDIKRTVQLTMTDIYADIFMYGSSTKNTCSGDSGGPALVNIDGEPTVIGIVSFGDQNCTQFGGDSRTDYFSGYISQFAGVGATPTPTPNPGGDDDDDDDDDDDGSTGPKDNGGDSADDPFSNVGCSIASVSNAATSPLGLIAMIGMVAFAARRRRE